MGCAPPAPETTPAAPGAPLSPKEARIAEVWRNVVGPTELNSSHNFYDVGGDSLAAMQVGLAMESAGFPHHAVRASLEGRSIGDIAALIDTAPEAHTTGIAPLPSRTIESWALNITRGFMVLTVLLSHWMPGVWKRVMPQLDFDPIAFISRMGTPGFAVTFGIGVGYFMLNGYPGNARSVHRRLRISFLLICAAIMLLAMTELLLLWLNGETLTGTRIGEAFYSVLAYYALACASMPLWLRLMNGRVGLVCAIAIPVIWLLWLLAGSAFGAGKLSTPLEFLRLMITANYSYLHMTPMVLAGIYIGVQMLETPDPRPFARKAALTGIFLMSMAFLDVYATIGAAPVLDRDALLWKGLDAAVFYCGFTCLFLAGAITGLHHRQAAGSAARTMMKILILLGGLALPIYAFHGMVIPVKNILMRLDLHGGLALSLSMGAFLAITGYGMIRLKRMYFA
ncbi:MAG: phosphopantetheine-binding protein [Tropicimonas sp.]|uniref:phosphopantetheine-binding protein n=1 Tax=Tropicimonas sp. TaxID=2067044 RepID=UPI003A8C05BC